MSRFASVLLLTACLTSLRCSPARSGAPPTDATECDVLVVGGSLGGCAAALGAAESGADVWLLEETDWIGGQVTSQGVSALDEHSFIETFGGTANYMKFRDRIRDLCGGKKNPGGGWVSRLCFEPRTGLNVLEKMLEGKVKVLRFSGVTKADVVDDRIVSVTLGDGRRFKPRMILDATDTGELLPVVGAEFELDAHPQSYTFPFVVEFRRGERHVIPKPEGYEEIRKSQPFTLEHYYKDRGWVRYGMFEKRKGTPGSFFDYRKIGPELALINWPGNDYRGRPGDDSGALGRWDEAKRLSLGFLYWLQTECPRDEGGTGYPELRLRPDLMDTADGLSKRPYVREGRRIVARKTIEAAELTPATARAALFRDSIGIGWYGMDVHSRIGDVDGLGGRWIATKPFQIPLGALVPVRLKNLLAACKNIGTTRETNGAYRVHPVEWAIGEAAGRTAAFCVRHSTDPRDVDVRALQLHLLETGVPLFWWVDVPVGHPGFVELQACSVWGRISIPDRLDFEPTENKIAQLRKIFSER